MVNHSVQRSVARGITCLALMSSLFACSKETTAGIPTDRTTATTAPQPQTSENVATSPPPTPSMTSESGWQLDITNLPTVELRNTSEKPQTILPDSKIQPSRLHLFDATGEEIIAVDGRARMKFNNTLQRTSYVTVGPGETIPFSNVVVVEDGNDSLVTHGPFRFSVKSGASYTGRIEWRSERNDYVDDSGAPQQLSEAWQGTVVSNDFTLLVE